MVFETFLAFMFLHAVRKGQVLVPFRVFDSKNGYANFLVITIPLYGVNNLHVYIEL